MHFIKPGHVVTLTAPSGGVVAGTCYLIGVLLVFSKSTVAAGAEFEGATEGVFEAAPKTTSQAWTEGAKLYWDDTTKKFTTTVGSNKAVGIAVSAELAAATTGTVLLTGAGA